MREYLTKHLQIVLTEEENLIFEELRKLNNNKSRSDFGRKLLLETINKVKDLQNEDKQN